MFDAPSHLSQTSTYTAGRLPYNAGAHSPMAGACRLGACRLGACRLGASRLRGLRRAGGLRRRNYGGGRCLRSRRGRNRSAGPPPAYLGL